MKRVYFSILAAALITITSCDDNNEPQVKAPELTTAEASEITASSAKAGGTIIDEGEPSYSERGVCYGTSPEPTTKIVVDGTGKGSFSVDLTGLASYTMYYVRAYATNVNGTVYGNEVNFTTGVLPTEFSKTEMYDITSSTATAEVTIANAGVPSYTERGICYGTTANPTITSGTKLLAEGTATVTFTVNLTDLEASSKYYVRAYAITPTATYYGEQVDFITEDEIPTLTMTTVMYGGATVIRMAGSGDITIDWGDGSEIQTYTLQVYSEIDWENPSRYRYSHGYSNASTHTITITGGDLTNFICIYGELTSLDVSKHTNLKSLECGFNKLVSLDLRNNTALEYFGCSDNLFASLDLSNHVSLQYLDCALNNQLTNLNVSGCRALIRVQGYYNSQLTSLDVSGCTALKELDCTNNDLINLNVSGCTSLIRLVCDNNRLQSLNVSSCRNLEYLCCENNHLTYLNVGGCFELSSLYCRYNELSSLNMSSCTALCSLMVSYNNFTDVGLNALFATLHSNDIAGKTVYILGNPHNILSEHFLSNGWLVVVGM